MAAEFAVVLEVLLDDTYAFHFIEEEDDDLPMFSIYASINCPEKFESRRAQCMFASQTGINLLHGKNIEVGK